MKMIKGRIEDELDKEVHEFLQLLPAGSMDVLLQTALGLYMELEGRFWMKTAKEAREYLHKDWKKALEARQKIEEELKKRHPVTSE